MDRYRRYAVGVSAIGFAAVLAGVPNSSGPTPTGDVVRATSNSRQTQSDGSLAMANLAGQRSVARYRETDPKQDAVAAFARGAESRRDRIAFSSNRTGTAQIWIMNADGSKQTRLTHSAPMEDIQPAFSPDGTKIAFSRSVPAWYESANLITSEIWVMDADGTDERVLATAPATTNFRPQWSPNGRKILFVRGTPAQAPFDIWVMDADGSNQRPVTTSGGSTYPTWSPDGKKIAYLSGLQVWVMNANGTGARRITKVGPNYVPSWAPGKRILFTSERDGGGKQIYVMNPDGSKQTRLAVTDGEDKMPTWSPDGRRIAFARGTRECGSDAGAVACQAGNDYEIHTMNADGSGVRRLTFTEMPERQFGENYPVWQPCVSGPRKCRRG